jgi:hypothetical protein
MKKYIKLMSSTQMDGRKELETLCKPKLKGKARTEPQRKPYMHDYKIEIYSSLLIS